MAAISLLSGTALRGKGVGIVRGAQPFGLPWP